MGQSWRNLLYSLCFKGVIENETCYNLSSLKEQSVTSLLWPVFFKSSIKTSLLYPLFFKGAIKNRPVINSLLQRRNQEQTSYNIWFLKESSSTKILESLFCKGSMKKVLQYSLCFKGEIKNKHVIHTLHSKCNQV